MVVFKKLRWKNFLSTGNIFTEIDLNSYATTVICGENGSGKSTMLDVLCFSLFGKSFRKINLDQLINSVNRKDMLVENVFSIGPDNYKVVRGRAPAVFEIYCNEELIDQSGLRDYQEHLEKNILKMNFVSFTQVVILGSSTFVPFMQLAAAQRRSVVEDLLDIRVFSSMNVLLKEKIFENKRDLIDNEKKITFAKERIAFFHDQITKIKEKHSGETSATEQEIASNLSMLQAKNTELQECENRAEELRQLASGLKKLTEREQELTFVKIGLSNKIKKIKSELDFFENNDECPTCTQEIDSHFKTKSIYEKGKTLLELERADLKADSKIAAIQDEILGCIGYKNKLALEEKRINSIKVDIQSITKYVEKLKGDLKQSNSSDSIESIENQISEIELEIKELKDELRVLFSDAKLYKIAAALLKDGGIKTQIIKRFIPIMNRLINSYLSNMNFFVEFELDEKFNETIRSRFRDVFSYSSFSEGEKKRIDLALLLTWRAVGKMKNSTNTNLLILDEVFDASLDQDGCDDFMKLLDELGDGMNIFVITHSQNMNTDKFSRSLTFSKEKNFSNIVEI